MAHRINFNVYRYGKTLQWNFSAPSTDVQNVLRINYIMIYWIRRVMKIWHIDVFKFFFIIGGEFPVVKIIGSRQLLFRRFIVPRTFSSFSHSRSVVDSETVLPVSDGRGLFSEPKYVTKITGSRAARLVPVEQSKKFLRATYGVYRAPLTSWFNISQHLRQFHVIDSCGDFIPQDAINYFFSLDASAPDASSLQNNFDFESDSSFNLKFDAGFLFNSFFYQLFFKKVKKPATSKLNFVADKNNSAAMQAFLSTNLVTSNAVGASYGVSLYDFFLNYSFKVSSSVFRERFTNVSNDGLQKDFFIKDLYFLKKSIYLFKLFHKGFVFFNGVERRRSARSSDSLKNYLFLAGGSKTDLLEVFAQCLESIKYLSVAVKRLPYCGGEIGKKTRPIVACFLRIYFLKKFLKTFRVKNKTKFNNNSLAAKNILLLAKSIFAFPLGFNLSCRLFSKEAPIRGLKLDGRLARRANSLALAANLSSFLHTAVHERSFSFLSVRFFDAPLRSNQFVEFFLGGILNNSSFARQDAGESFFSVLSSFANGRGSLGTTFDALARHLSKKNLNKSFEDLFKFENNLFFNETDAFKINGATRAPAKARRKAGDTKVVHTPYIKPIPMFDDLKTTLTLEMPVEDRSAYSLENKMKEARKLYSKVFTFNNQELLVKKTVLLSRIRRCINLAEKFLATFARSKNVQSAERSFFKGLLGAGVFENLIKILFKINGVVKNDAGAVLIGREEYSYLVKLYKFIDELGVALKNMFVIKSSSLKDKKLNLFFNKNFYEPNFFIHKFFIIYGKRASCGQKTFLKFVDCGRLSKFNKLTVRGWNELAPFKLVAPKASANYTSDKLAWSDSLHIVAKKLKYTSKIENLKRFKLPVNCNAVAVTAYSLGAKVNMFDDKLDTGILPQPTFFVKKRRFLKARLDDGESVLSAVNFFNKVNSIDFSFLNIVAEAACFNTSRLEFNFLSGVSYNFASTVSKKRFFLLKHFAATGSGGRLSDFLNMAFIGYLVNFTAKSLWSLDTSSKKNISLIGKKKLMFSHAIKSFPLTAKATFYKTVKHFSFDSADRLGFLGPIVANSSILSIRGDKEMAQFLEERTLFLNMSSSFYTIFGVYFDIYYYSIDKLFLSDPRMQALASKTATFVREYVTRNNKAIFWLNEFVIAYYLSIFLKSTDYLIGVMALRFGSTKYWVQPLFFMMNAIRGVDLRSFGITGLRIGFHGKFNGQDRAYRMYRVWGTNPCLRNGHLVGSYSSVQILSPYGITELHMWMAYL